MIIAGYAYVNESGQSFPLQNGIHGDEVITGWRRITEAVHESGGKIAMQIAHGGKQIKSSLLGGRRAAVPSAVPNLEAYFLTYAEKLRPLLNIPLILVGGVRRPETAEKIIQSGAADLVSMARPLIREPGLSNKWSKGDLQPAQCVSCNCCMGEVEQGNKLKCYWSSRPLSRG